MNTVVSVFGIEPSRIGGAEAYARELSVQLGKRGWRSVLCFLKEPPDHVRDYLKLDNVDIEVVEDSWRPNWQAVMGLRRVLIRHRPEILHLHFTGFLSPYPWLAKLCSVEQVFFTDHSSQPEGHVIHRAPFWKRQVARFVNKPLTGVVAVSDFGRRCITGRDLIAHHQVKLVYNSADLSRASASSAQASDFRRRHSIPEDRSLIVQVSWLIPEKGISDLLAAARIAISQNPKVHFGLVGDGAYRLQYERAASDLGIRDHVTFTGLVEDPLSEGVYVAADVVCQVSRWEEVFGYVIAEAMASSKPIVATRVGGIPELVEDGKTGFLVERGDVNAIANRILELVASPDMRERMGVAARESACAKFDLSPNVEKIVEMYGIKTPAPSMSRCMNPLAAL